MHEVATRSEVGLDFSDFGVIHRALQFGIYRILHRLSADNDILSGAKSIPSRDTYGMYKNIGVGQDRN
jgi:hypothetical protein